MSGRLPSVGLVVPSFNQGQFLAQALKSTFNQENVSLKVALCDAGSTDETLSLIGLYRDRLTFFRSHQDRGQAAAINEGISQLRETSYVGWLNADDVLLPDGLGVMARFLDQHSEYIAVFGKAYVIDEKGNVAGEYPTRPFRTRAFAIHCTICQPASLIRRWAWDAVGGVNESIQTCMDYDLWWRLSKIGRIGYLEQFVACTRDHAHSKTRMQRKIVNDEAVSILLRHWGMVPLNWCIANILEGPVESQNNTYLGRRWEAARQYIQINRWKAFLPQNWLLHSFK